MATVDSMNKYWEIRHCQDRIHLVSDSQDIAALADYLSLDDLEEYGCFFEEIGDAEIVRIWGVTTSIPYNTSHVDLVFSDAALRYNVNHGNCRCHQCGSWHKWSKMTQHGDHCYCQDCAKHIDTRIGDHWIGMAGFHGCLPETCAAYDSYDSAVDSLAEIHELGQKRTAALRRDGYLELNVNRDGNEYIEITHCDCDDPDQHDDC